MGRRTLTTDLTQGNIPVQLLKFVGPLFLSNALQMVYNLVDTIVVGQFVGNSGLSAVSVCGEIIHILTFVAFGFSSAGQILIAQYTGANRPDKTNKIIGNLFSSLLIVSLFFSTVSLVFHEKILDFANIPDEARKDATAYLLTYSAGLIFQCGYNAVSSILRGMGDSKHPFVFIGIAAVMNVFLDLLFVAVVGWGTFGAALATIISMAFSFAVSMIFLYRNKQAFGFDFKPESFAFSREALLPLIKLGIPMGIQFGMIQMSKLIITRWINVYGVSVSAITGIGSKLNGIGVIFSQAVNTGAAAIIGQSIGAEKYGRVRKTIGVAFIMSTLTGTLLALPVLTVPEIVFSIFTSDADVLAMTQAFMPVVIVMLYASAIRAPFMGLINGSGNSRVNIVVAVMDGLVAHLGITALVSFGLDAGLSGLWFCNAAAGSTPFFVGIVYYISGKWKKRCIGSDKQ